MTKKSAALVVSVVICLIVAIILFYVPQSLFNQQQNRSSVVVIIQPGASVNASLGFEPSTITVVIGVNNTVIWKNEDSDWHDVHSDTGLFYSGIIQPGASWTYTFMTPGRYQYVCDPHPWMTGTVNVISAGPST